MTPKRHFEINWPLISQEIVKSNLAERKAFLILNSSLKRISVEQKTNPMLITEHFWLLISSGGQRSKIFFIMIFVKIVKLHEISHNFLEAKMIWILTPNSILRKSSRWGGGPKLSPPRLYLPSNSTPPHLMMYANTVLSGRFSLQKMVFTFFYDFWMNN